METSSFDNNNKSDQMPDSGKNPNGIKSQIESILFVAHKPLKLKDLSGLVEEEQDAIKSILDEMAEERKGSGIVLLESSEGYQMATNSANSTVIKNFLNAELRKKLTDATVEVLAIIAYRQPISKAEIEAIRGVNSQYSLRILLMRGLIEKIPNPTDHRSFLYQTTSEFLMHIGLSSVKDLPSFEELTELVKLPETPEIQIQNPPAENPEAPPGAPHSVEETNDQPEHQGQ